MTVIGSGSGRRLTSADLRPTPRMHHHHHTQGKGKWQSSIVFAPCGTRTQRHLVEEEPVH
jgi:hypothetical protein